MPVVMSTEEFDACVEQAIAQVPAQLWQAVENCVVMVEDDAPDDDPDVLGFYDGIPVTERDSGYAGVLPDRIFIFRKNLMDMCSDRDELIDEIRITVVHELAHYFGLDDDHLDDLGYA